MSKTTIGLHWVTLERNEFIFIDSLSSTNYTKLTERVVKLIHYTKKLQNFDVRGLQFFSAQSPRQPFDNGYDCGVFACMFVNRILSRNSTFFKFNSKVERENLRKVIRDKKLSCEMSSINEFIEGKFDLK